VIFGGHGTATNTTSRWFDGKLDDLVLYRSALSAADVSQLAAGSVGHRAGITAGPVTVNVTVGPPSLKVTSLLPTATGFTATVNRPLDVAVLNLYDAPAGTLGPADVTLVGSSGGSVQGSLVLDSSATRLTFLATGGLLPPDTYTVTLRGAAGGFRDTIGNALDGNSDGAPGDPFTATFTIAASPAPTVSVPDFTRGPGQPVQVPAGGAGLPLRLSSSAGVTSVSLTLRYDATLLTLSGAAPGPGLPTNATVSLDASTPGLALLSFSSPTPLPSGIVDFVRLTASVPAAAPYGSRQVLDLQSVLVDGLAAGDDDGLHLAAYLGDATGNAGHSGLDATLVSRVAVGLGSGFAAFPLIDPRLVGDVTGNGSLGSLDAALLLQMATGLSPLEIPPLPPGAQSTFTGAPDPPPSASSPPPSDPAPEGEVEGEGFLGRPGDLAGDTLDGLLQLLAGRKRRVSDGPGTSSVAPVYQLIRPEEERSRRRPEDRR
jgi:hypothetical protein